MNEAISPDSNEQMVEAWAKGWAITRHVAPSIKEHGGFRTDPFWPRQLRRYLFTEINDGFKVIAHEVKEPWIFLKVCAAAELVREWLP